MFPRHTLTLPLTLSSNVIRDGHSVGVSLLGPARLIRRLRFLWLARGFGLADSGVGLLMLSFSIPSSLIVFPLDRVAVVTWITQLRRNIKLNLRRLG
jgi:hypothetical protein